MEPVSVLNHPEEVRAKVLRHISLRRLEDQNPSKSLYEHERSGCS